MAKKALINREKKREVVRNKYATKRNEIKATLKKLLKDAENNRDEIHECYLALARLPRDSSPVRKRNRCALTGRPRGYYRKVGLCRNMFRIYAMQGEIPGLVKSSW